MRFILTIILLALISGCSSVKVFHFGIDPAKTIGNQQPDKGISWGGYYYEKDQNVNFRLVRPLEDGSAIILGNRYSRESQKATDLVILKLSAGGDLEWYKQYNPGIRDGFYGIHPTDDGGFLMPGTIMKDANTQLAYLFKIDSTGNKVWEKYYDEEKLHAIQDLKMLNDGRMIIAGFQYDPVNVRKGKVAMLAADGELLWIRQVATESTGMLTAIETDALGQIYASGWQALDGLRKGLYVIFDLDGNLVNTGAMAHSGEFDKTITDMVNIDGRLVTAGLVKSLDGQKRSYVSGLGENGSVQWESLYENDSYSGAMHLRLTAANDLIMASNRVHKETKGDGILTRMNDRGEIIWSNIYANSNDEILMDVQPMPDGGFIAVGYSFVAGAGDAFAGWVIRTNNNGNINRRYVNHELKAVQPQLLASKPTKAQTAAVFNPNIKYGTMTDQDGNVYKTVTIGTQTWMAENLRTTTYNDGTPIPNVTGNSEWANLNTGAWCAYQNDNSNADTYGLLYNWYAVDDSRNIAPEGWHVPTHDEFGVLTNYLRANGYNIGKSLASKTGWNSFTNPGTVGYDMSKNNASGFSALPAAYRYSYNGRFDYLGSSSEWWSATKYGKRGALAYNHGLTNTDNRLTSGYRDLRAGLSVRLIKDSNITATATNECAPEKMSDEVRRGYSTLISLVGTANFDKAEALIEKLGLDVGAGYSMSPLPDSRCTTVLYRVVKGRRVTAEKVRFLVEHGANVNARNETNRYKLMPLHIAAGVRDLSVVTALVEAGADVNALTGVYDRETAGRSPLFIASNNPEVFLYLIDKGAIFRDTKEALEAFKMILTQTKSVKQAERMLDKKMVKLAETHMLYTLIRRLVMDPAMFKLALRYGADPYAEVKPGMGKNAFEYIEKRWGGDSGPFASRSKSIIALLKK